MPDDIDLRQAFDRAAGAAPNAPAALAGVRTRIRRAHQRRALARGGAGLLGVVAVGGVIMNIGGDGSGTEIALTGPSPSDSSGLTSTTFASTSAPTAPSEPLTTNTVAPSASAPASSAAPTLPPVNSSVPGTFELVPTTRPSGLQAAVFTTAGGTIVVDYTSNAMTLTSVTASPGWTVAESRARPDDIEVRFEDEDGDESKIRVRFVDGRPVQDEERQGPGSDDDPSDDDPSDDDSSGEG